MRQLSKLEMKAINGGYRFDPMCASCVTDQSQDCSQMVAMSFCQSYTTEVYCGYGPYPGECIYDENSNLIGARPPECQAFCPN